MNLNDDGSDEENNYRAPIPSKKQSLIYGEYDNFEEYKRKINENNDYDDDMKQALIATRMDFLMENMPELLVDSNSANSANSSNTISNDEYMDRVIKLSEVANKMSEIIDLNKNLGTRLKNKISDYINFQIDIITFDNESLIDIEYIFDKIKLNPNIQSEVFNIIVPEDQESFIQYKQIIEQSKKDYQALEEKLRLQQEKIRLEKEREQNEIALEKERRIGITNILMSKILKIVNFDKEAKELKEILTPYIENFNNIIIHYISLNDSDFDKLNKFINKTRFTEKEKNDILKIFI